MECHPKLEKQEMYSFEYNDMDFLLFVESGTIIATLTIYLPVEKDKQQTLLEWAVASVPKEIISDCSYDCFSNHLAYIDLLFYSSSFRKPILRRDVVQYLKQLTDAYHAVMFKVLLYSGKLGTLDFNFE